MFIYFSSVEFVSKLFHKQNVTYAVIWVAYNKP